jgi:toxin HigB-1
MILSFRCAQTQALFAGNSPKRLVNATAVAERKLQMLHRAVRIEDLRIPPQNRLEKPKGDRKGTWSIRINIHWRVCFLFENGNADEVEIVDYH